MASHPTCYSIAGSSHSREWAQLYFFAWLYQIVYCSRIVEMNVKSQHIHIPGITMALAYKKWMKLLFHTVLFIHVISLLHFGSHTQGSASSNQDYILVWIRLWLLHLTPLFLVNAHSCICQSGILYISYVIFRTYSLNIVHKILCYLVNPWFHSLLLSALKSTYSDLKYCTFINVLLLIIII